MRTSLLAAAVLLLPPRLVSGAPLSQAELTDAYHKSYSYERTQDYTNAIKALAGVHRAMPLDYTVNLRLGWLYHSAGNYANAEQYYGQAIKAAPGAVEAELGLMLPLLAQGRYQDVEVLAKKVIQVDYCNYFANMRLVLALRLQKKYDAAAKVANKMLVLYPTDVSFLVQQAQIEQAQGNAAAAEKHFRAALLLDPENVAAKKALEKK